MLFYRFLVFLIFWASTPVLAGWLVGQAKVDVTGPVFDTATMGYAVPTPMGSGLHQNLYARAFVLEGQDSQKVFLIHVDTCFVTIALKERVVKNLQFAFPYSDISHANVMIMASHTHSGPGGFSNHFYYNAPTKGMVAENFEALQKGITKAAMSAYTSRRPSKVTWQRSQLLGGAKNRSIEPYMQNPKNERQQLGQNTDPTFDQLQFYNQGGNIKGVFNWFAAHATSMKKTNTLISGDNKGYAQYWLEQELGVKNPGFISAFANANGGDASPNIAGDIDGDRAWECQANENLACAEEIGLMQAKKAKSLANREGESLRPQVHVRHQFVDMSQVEVDGASTCPAAVGISMLAGSTEDGQGVGEEGVNCSLGFGPFVDRGCKPKFACQGEKPVVVQGGLIGWLPNILPVQLVQIGHVAIVALPAEFTTMAGHRVRKQLEKSMEKYGVKAVIFAGYANGYSSYVTTEEEYALQHYEGASTLFGPKTLRAYQKVLAGISRDFDQPNPAETVFPELVEPNKVASANLNPAPRIARRNFGFMVSDVGIVEANRGDIVSFEAFANNPNFSIFSQRTLMAVERYDGSGWKKHLDASDWNTAVSYNRGRAEVRWSVADNTPAGHYRLAYFGCYYAECYEEFKTASSSFFVP
jgi:neutral ceramidase